MKAFPQHVRMVTVASAFLGLFAITLMRAVQLCVVQSGELRGRATEQHEQEVERPSERGAILDRHGEKLALTVESASIFIRPRTFDPRFIDRVARTLAVPAALVEEKAAAKEKFVWLMRDATAEQATALAALRLKGIGTENNRRRVYPRGSLAGQILGTAGTDLQGLGGIERSYDAKLRGAPRPVRVERDARGERMSRDGIVDPLADSGARVELTLDATLQQVTEGALQNSVVQNRAAAGTAIVMDPHSGEILALAHYPFFDPKQRELAETIVARNRAISDTFEPGSTFKAIIAAAAMEAGLVRPDERLNCEGGSWAVGKRVIHDHEHYGWLTFSEVIKHSSNICTAKVGERMGAQRLVEALRGFGFHTVTGVDLPGEKATGLRPWQKWGRINVVTTSFGQGIAVTPMQLIRAYAALANGGKLLKPYIVKRVVGADGTVLQENHPEVLGQPISAATAAAVTNMLRGVVEAGTGTKAQVEGIEVAGKTGTAQKVDPHTGRYSARDRMSSFIGYLPADNPRYVILVVIDTPRSATYGGLVAAPAFKNIADFGVDRLGLRIAAAPTPAPPEERPAAKAQLVSWQQQAAPGGMPSFLGLSMREALRQAQRAGWEVRCEGSGFVVAQDPPPGAPNADGRVLSLRLGAITG